MWFLPILVVSAALNAASPPQTVWYVDAWATGARTGESWLNAFTELQPALAIAQPSDEIWVAEGTYWPDYDQATNDYSNDRNRSFVLRDGVGIYGGFRPGDGARDARSGSFQNTVLSGDIGIGGYAIDNSIHVVIGSGTGSSAILDGFTIEWGRAVIGGLPDNSGAGLLNVNGSPTLNHCTFQFNTSTYGGAVLNYEQSAPSIFACTFYGNQATGGGAGGAMHNNTNSSPHIVNCHFESNACSFMGGAIANQTGCSPTITGCSFVGNTVSQVGGGAISNQYSCSPVVENCLFVKNGARTGGAIYNASGSSPQIVDCEFRYNTAIGNSSQDGGGALGNSSSCDPVVRNCYFLANSSLTPGGAIVSDWLCDPVVTNSVFVGNRAPNGAAVFTDNQCFPFFKNCTFAQNEAPGGAAFASQYTNPVTVTNSIFWNNGDAEINQLQSVTAIDFSDVQGDWPGRRNIDQDPLFVRNPIDGGDGWGDDPNTLAVDEGANDDFGDLRLQVNSPAINRGDPSFSPSPNCTDLAGNPRVTRERVDMGAFEFCFAGFDCDGVINVSDFVIWPECSGDSPLPVECVALDFNNDGRVDLFDFAAMQRLWE